MRDVFLASGVRAPEETDFEAPGGGSRLRRMDLFGRAGFRAGMRAWAAAGLGVTGIDPRAGVVVGTRFGCAPAIAEHALRLASSERGGDVALAPSVFAATVHNTVNGELAIALGLGGTSETIVSGRTAGLEALILAARRVAGGNADQILVVAAEGIDDAIRAAWEEEKTAFGERASGVDLVETAAAVLLEAREEASDGKAALRYVAGTLFFEPDARRAEARLMKWIGGIAPSAVMLCGPVYEDFLEGKGGKERSVEPRIERFCAAGVYEIASAVSDRNATAPNELRRSYVTRDPAGAVAAVTLEAFSL